MDNNCNKNSDFHQHDIIGVKFKLQNGEVHSIKGMNVYPQCKRKNPLCKLDQCAYVPAYTVAKWLNNRA